MKINRLKFKELTSTVNNRQLKLDIFHPQVQLFKAQTPRLRLRNSKMGISSGQMSSRDPRQFKNTSYINSKRSDPQTKKDELFFMSKSLIRYLYLITPEERLAIGDELEDVLALLTKSDCLKQVLGLLARVENELSIRYKNRLVHLVFYTIYSHILRQDGSMTDLELRNARLMQYYSRKFNFRELALAVCMSMQQLYLKLCDYVRSRDYARKALKLAVVLGDSYQESKMIEALGKLNYYEGRLNSVQPQILSQEERRRIIENYDEERQTPNIVGFDLDQKKEEVPEKSAKSKVKDENFDEFAFETASNFIENNFQNDNFKYFQSNYHDIAKELMGRGDLRGAIRRVGSVGVVRKYFGRDNYISIKPQGHLTSPQHQQQVLVTHRKARNRGGDSRGGLKRAIKTMQEVIDCYHIE